MTIGIFTLEFHLPESRSLKSRRQALRKLKDRLRARYNVSVAELPELSELWQRAGIVVVSIASGRDPLERLYDSILADAERDVPGPLVEAGSEFLDGTDSFGEESSP